LMEKYPFGVGVGAIGHGAVAGNGTPAAGNFVSVDSGVVAAFLAFGWIAGATYIFGTLIVLGFALAAAVRSRSPAALALAVAAAAGCLTMVFTNLVGLQGIVIWLPAAMALVSARQTPKRGAPVRPVRTSYLPLPIFSKFVTDVGPADQETGIRPAAPFESGC